MSAARHESWTFGLPSPGPAATAGLAGRNSMISRPAAVAHPVKAIRAIMRKAQGHCVGGIRQGRNSLAAKLHTRRRPHYK